MIAKTLNFKSDEGDVEEENPSKNIPKEVYIVAQEIKIAKALAGNDPKQRAKQLKKLRKWFLIRSNSSFQFNDDDFLRLWKGLFYCMWMSDKPLVQEALAEELGQLIECFTDIKIATQFFGAFLNTMCMEWFGIDQWRMDKFLMLVRRMLRYMFYQMKKDNWSNKSLKEFNSQVSATVLTTNAIGLSMHFIDVFLEELAKVSNGDIEGKSVVLLLKPFVKFLASQKEFKLLGHIRDRIFYHLLWQSDLGRDYSERYNAWKEMGFPTTSIDDIEKVDDISENEIETDKEVSKEKFQLDPRAGNVDVFMPTLPVESNLVIKNIEAIMYKEETNTKSRKFLKLILEKYKTFSNGEFPLGVKTMPKFDFEPMTPLIEEKVSNLEKLDDELHSTTRKIKMMNKKKRRKLLASLNYDVVTEDNFDALIESALPDKISKISKRKNSLVWIEEEIETPKKKKKSEKRDKIENGLEEKEMEIKSNNKNVEIIESKNSQKDNNSDKENSNETKLKSDWDSPLQKGEIEYFLPSKKIKMKEANKKLLSRNIVTNPFAKKNKNKLKTTKKTLLGKAVRKLDNVSSADILKTPTSLGKKVKIALQKNMIQKPSEYIKQVRSSPQLPYDADKKPTKSLLKPNLMPSPINPFYKQKIGFKYNF